MLFLFLVHTFLSYVHTVLFYCPYFYLNSIFYPCSIFCPNCLYFYHLSIHCSLFHMFYLLSIRFTSILFIPILLSIFHTFYPYSTLVTLVHTFYPYSIFVSLVLAFYSYSIFVSLVHTFYPYSEHFIPSPYSYPLQNLLQKVIAAFIIWAISLKRSDQACSNSDVHLSPITGCIAHINWGPINWNITIFYINS